MTGNVGVVNAKGVCNDKRLRTFYYPISKMSHIENPTPEIVGEHITQMCVDDGRSTGVILVTEDRSSFTWMTPCPDLMVRSDVHTEQSSFTDYMMLK